MVGMYDVKTTTLALPSSPNSKDVKKTHLSCVRRPLQRGLERWRALAGSHPSH